MKGNMGTGQKSAEETTTGAENGERIVTTTQFVERVLVPRINEVEELTRQLKVNINQIQEEIAGRSVEEKQRIDKLQLGNLTLANESIWRASEDIKVGIKALQYAGGDLYEGPQFVFPNDK